jgi:hypothetical protein
LNHKFSAARLIEKSGFCWVIKEVTRQKQVMACKVAQVSVMSLAIIGS